MQILEVYQCGKITESKIQYYTNKYLRDIACSYDYGLVCVDYKFSWLFKTYLGKDAFYNFMLSMIEESKYCSGEMKKQLNKETVMTKEDNENFNYSKGQICDNSYVNNGVKVRDHCHATGKYRGQVHRDCNINLKLNYKILVVFHLIMQKLGNFNLKICYNKCIRKIYYQIHLLSNKLLFINSFQFLSL